MANLKQEFGSSNSITITLDSLASAGARESTVVDNSADKFLDAIVQVVLSVGTVSGGPHALVYVYGSEDGSTYTDNATGADADITLRDPSCMRLAMVIPTPISSQVYESQPFSVAASFGGIMPRKWGIVVKNNTGAALAASANVAKYTGVYATVG